MKTIFTLLLGVILLSCDKEDPCPDKNCSDFNTQAEAQSVYDSNRDCYKDLDADNDGKACESLP